MNREDIIRMAREADDLTVDQRGCMDFSFDEYGLERFAQLVADHVRSPEWLARRTNAAIAAERDRMCKQFNISKELAHEKAKSYETD